MNITKIVTLLEQVEDSIHNEDLQKATEIIGYLIDDIIRFEMAHEEDFKMIHDVIMKIRGNNDEIGRARMLSGDIVGEA